MLNPKTDQEWIDDFLQGQLVEAELVKFQRKLKEDFTST